MTVAILTEKASAAQNFAKALGAGRGSGMRGNYNGEDFIIVHASGHLYEFLRPEDMVKQDRRDFYERWSLDNLPWDPDELSWLRQPQRSAGKLLATIKDNLAGVDEIVIATDVDPTGEGQLIAWEILEKLPAPKSHYSRMYFTDEAAQSIQKAFVERKTIPSQQEDGEYRKANFRSKFDFLSIQWTRAATKVLETTGRRAVLRNGRLKSAMSVIVADGLAAHHNYKKIPFYQNRFKDDQGVIYTNPKEPRFEKKDDVPQEYTESGIRHLKTERKYTKPPQLLDLAGLSSILVREGIKASEVMDVYQKMYEAHVVSYPRTEDKCVTPEQFNELLPKIDSIAHVVGIDPNKLTQRKPRTDYVKEGGAHGANRPGPNVPDSLDAVEAEYGHTGRRIYEILAKNYLTILAENYSYDHIKGCVDKYPDFVGSVSVPVEMGWKDIFDTHSLLSDDAEDKEAKPRKLGTTAQPFIHEGFPPRPQHPTMAWLMKQLAQHSVGTGATRTTTYADITQGKDALLKDTKGKITMTVLGEANVFLIRGTRIADLAVTEHVYAQMDQIEHGELDPVEPLRNIATWIQHDISVMQENAEKMADDFATSLKAAPVKEKAQGVFNGQQIQFNRSFGSYRYSDADVEALLRGDTIEFEFEAKGRKFKATGHLAQKEFEGRKYYGLECDAVPIIDPTTHAQGTWVKEPDSTVTFKRSFGTYSFSDDDVATLLAGNEISFEVDGKYGRSRVTGGLAHQEYKGKSYVGFKAESFERVIDPETHVRGRWVKEPDKDIIFKRIFGGYRFSDDEVKDLLDGKEISFKTDKSPQPVKGRLERQEYKGKSYVGLKAQFSVDTSLYAVGEWVGEPGKTIKFKKKWSDHDFDDQEVKDLLAGKVISFDSISKKTKKKYTAKGKLARLTFLNKQGEKVSYVGFELMCDDKDKKK